MVHEIFVLTSAAGSDNNALRTSAWRRQFCREEEVRRCFISCPAIVSCSICTSVVGLLIEQRSGLACKHNGGRVKMLFESELAGVRDGRGLLAISCDHSSPFAGRRAGHRDVTVG